MFTKKRQKTPRILGVFWRFISEQFWYFVAESTQKSFFHQNDVRNVFSNIELTLGYNIMTLEYVLERIWKEISKNMWKKGKVARIRHFLGWVLSKLSTAAEWGHLVQKTPPKGILQGSQSLEKNFFDLKNVKICLNTPQNILETSREQS